MNLFWTRSLYSCHDEWENRYSGQVWTDGSTGWVIGGAFGGTIGAVAFGIVIFVLGPEILMVTIPAIYGLEPVGPLGWVIHIAHGIILGVIFGLLVMRDSILGILRTDVETDALSQAGIILRMIGAGFVYGMTVWAILPLIVLPVWITTVGVGEQIFPATPVISLLGHALFGVVLGAIFAATVDLRDQTVDKRLES